eukprot:g60485.t1
MHFAPPPTKNVVAQAPDPAVEGITEDVKNVAIQPPDWNMPRG